MKIYLDKSSVEVFLNNGEYVMTDIVFPEEEYNALQVFLTNGEGNLEKITVSYIESIWNK